MIYWNIFLSFLRIGIFGYGGGPSMIPLFHAECVKKQKWLSDEEFADSLALGNTLPGPIATKMAAYIGYKVKGWIGSVIAILAVSMPIAILMILLLTLLYRMQENSFFQRTISAIQPVIAVMMGVLTYQFFIKSWKETGNKGSVFFLLFLSILLIPVLGIHPGILIAVLLLSSFLYTTWLVRKGRRAKEGGEE
ncbi:Uncharacterized transporter YwrB [[Clostridium] ultunense Esp]|uniref:chromate transporter n=1 Tax=Thermicanus aegyptius TaxID=94009 RepID=UPI0002B6FEC1|nr:chromate transporter [Thermicanus aegyptius]CCQ97053.1 Uncharacterized transporter YwrB [[Clostridium] ultunense Esp]